MRFCTNCGTKQEEQRFCTSCGHKLETEISQKESQPSQPTKQTTKRVEKKKKRPMPRFMKVILLLLGIILILTFGVHKYLENLYSPQKTVEQFEEALTEQSINKSKKVLTYSNFNEKPKDEEIEEYLAFLKEDLSIIVNQLSDQAEIYEAGEHPTRLIIDEQDNELIHLVKDQKKFGIYQTYKVDAIPFDVTLFSNLDGVEIDLLNKKETLKEDSLTISNILPGLVELKGTFKGDYVELTEQLELDFLNASSNNLEAELEFDSQYINIYSNEENGTVFVNGNSTGEKIVDVNDFGPLPLDGSIALHAEYKTEDGAIQTKEVKVNDGNEVYLEFEENELSSGDSEESSAFEPSSLEQFMQDYIEASVEAMNAGDFSIVEPLHHPDGKSYKESKDYVDYIYSEGIKEEVLSVELVDYEETENGYWVNATESYNIYYADGSKKEKEFTSEYKVTTKENEFQLWELESTDEI